MAILSHLSTLSAPSQNLYAFNFTLQHQHRHQHNLTWGTSRFPYLILVSSSNNSRVSSIIARARKGVKSNEELCIELKEFVSVVGFPEGYVPSFKDLLQHGRKDLAHVVRRRGYKLIAELLMNPTNGDSDRKMISDEIQEASNENEAVDGEGQDQKVKELDEGDTDLKMISDEIQEASNENEALDGKGQDQNVKELVEGGSSSGGDSKMETTLSCRIGFPGEGVPIESSTSLSFQEKASKFVLDGVLDADEDGDDAMEVDYVISSGNGAAAGESFADLNSGIIGEYGEPDAESWMTDNQVKVNNLKKELDQKEMELSELKERIEKEKIILSTLQANAEYEIDKVQKIISLKDEELKSAEESLSGLKEVKIEYWGTGEIVEVAGSFNGWHHRIEMDTDSSSSAISATNSRRTGLWSTFLWLYPGVYEIKFIVDGIWMTDPSRELTTKGSIQNNILRVDR